MVTKTIPSKPKASKMEAELSAEEDSLTPEQEAEALSLIHISEPTRP